MEFPDPKYREICSTETLHSCKQGFFASFCSGVVDHVGKKWINGMFAEQKLEEDKIRIVFRNRNAWDAIQEVLQNVKPVYRTKSARASQDTRLEGEKQYYDKNYNKAALLFSQSIIRAPALNTDSSVDNGLTLPLAYKWRAKTFYHLRRYKDCLSDLNSAIREGIPNNARHEIYHRMGDCHLKLGDEKKGKISLQLAVKMVDDLILQAERAKIDKEMKEKVKILITSLTKEREEIKKLISSIGGKTKTEKEDGLMDNAAKHPLPTVSGSTNDKYANASNLITIKQSPEAGRFAVAAEKISTGATLVVEEPYASCLIPEMFSSHCHHCYSRLDAAIPCKTCSGVAFCSTECRDTSTSTYHKYECPYLGLFIGSGMSVLSFLSLRMITQESVSFFRQLHGKVQAVQTGTGDVQFTEKEMGYMNIYKLVTHSDVRENEDYFKRTLMAIFLVKCLKKAGFFGRVTDSEELSEDEILTASLILRHLQLLQFNAHEIYETKVQTPGKTKGAKSVYIAVGIYPTVALFNHECSAAVTRYYHGKNIVIRAVRPIAKGEIVSENYGPVFTKRTLSERTRELTSRYWFKCDCEACFEDWPKIEQLSEDDYRLRCTTEDCTGILKRPTKPKTDSQCPKCFNKINTTSLMERISRLETMFENGLQHMDEKNCETAVPLFVSFLDEIHKLVAPPCRLISLCQEALRTCYAQTGNLWICD